MQALQSTWGVSHSLIQWPMSAVTITVAGVFSDQVLAGLDWLLVEAGHAA
jgi:hypothetical protein